MRILTIDAALAESVVGAVVDGVIQAERRGPSGSLPSLAQDLLAEHPHFDLVAATVGPGSFTGLRSALALAHGLALAAGVPVLGVTLGEALAARAPPGRSLWTAIDSKRGRIFLEIEGEVRSLSLDALPTPAGPVAVAGDAAIPVAARLAARGRDVMLLDARMADPQGIARAAAEGRTRPPAPLYVDPPEARPGPPGRPAPV